jgi:hypothetical protein
MQLNQKQAETKAKIELFARLFGIDPSWAVAVAMTLPSVGPTEDGARVTFVKAGAARLILGVSDTDCIHDSTAGATIYTDSDYATITLEYVHSITRWVIISAAGSWTTT